MSVPMVPTSRVYSHLVSSVHRIGFQIHHGLEEKAVTEDVKTNLRSIYNTPAFQSLVSFICLLFCRLFKNMFWKIAKHFNGTQPVTFSAILPGIYCRLYLLILLHLGLKHLFGVWFLLWTSCSHKGCKDL